METDSRSGARTTGVTGTTAVPRVGPGAESNERSRVSNVLNGAPERAKSEAKADLTESAADHSLASSKIFRRESAITTVLLLLAVCTRFFRIGYPANVVFDEFHFGKFVNWTLQRSYYFDIHPPLGKLILAAGGWLLGYEPVKEFNYDKIGTQYDHTQFLALRLIAAAFGAGIVPLCFKVARELGFSLSASTLAASCMLLDNMLLVESRLILVDSQLIFFCVLSMLCALRLWNCTASHWSRERIGWLAATAFAGSAALSIKWTALAFPGLIALESFFALLVNPSPLLFSECAFAAVLGLVPYCTAFYVHFLTVTHSGKGDNFMNDEFKRRLIGHKTYDPNLPRRWFWDNFIELNARMYISNKNLTGKHNWQSRWYQWIVNWRGVLYYSNYNVIGADGIKRTQKVYLLGNPAVLWLSLACVCIFVCWLLLLLRYRDSIKAAREGSFSRRRFRVGVFLLIGWILNLLPYILVDRSSFLYHYLPALFFAELLTAFMADLLPTRARAVIVSALVVAMAAAFVYWAPWSYAIFMPSSEHSKRQWLSKWN